MKDLKLVGSRFTSLNANRAPDFDGKLSIANNIKITNFKQIKESKDTMSVSYEFKIDYAELGVVEIQGILFFQGHSKTIKILQKSWDDKKFDTPEHMIITNLILKKATIKALELEEELGLPTHIKLPSLKGKTSQE